MFVAIFGVVGDAPTDFFHGLIAYWTIHDYILALIGSAQLGPASRLVTRRGAELVRIILLVAFRCVLL